MLASLNGWHFRIPVRTTVPEEWADGKTRQVGTSRVLVDERQLLAIPHEQAQTLLSLEELMGRFQTEQVRTESANAVVIDAIAVNITHVLCHKCSGQSHSYQFGNTTTNL